MTQRTRFDHFALGRLPAGTMNKTEAGYAQHLEALKKVGDVLWYRFEGIKLRLADKTFLTPDFAVMSRDGVMELHDVKGFMMDDANVKIKIAAEQYPFRFYIIRKSKLFWNRSLVGREDQPSSPQQAEEARSQTNGTQA